ncbi:nucleotide-diphospho-sugar transferase [Fusarium acuminatum]|uniref:Nucleotide-diphospho-sugar transferase n=1 Tax=Fusarium acuminatum TaxID=5515 RepID=A0ABZ2X1F8_9HYPO
MSLFTTWPTALPAKSHTLARIFPAILVIVPLAATLSCTWFLSNDVWTQVFCTLFILRYLRLLGHVLGSWIYRPSQISADPAFTRRDVTVILPTIDPHGPDFRECVESILANHPACILVVTVGDALREECRTAVYRTEFLNNADLLQRFCHEKFCFGLFGGEGLGPDDDNFLTRDAMKKHWLICFQDTEDATIETTLGEYPKFRDQLLRWARTTVRSNPVMLRDPVFVSRYPWSAFMVYWAALFNFALIWDTLLLIALIKAEGTRATEVLLLLMWMFWTKVVKIIPHFLRHPSDFPLVICQILFGYAHSFIKLWALVTFWDCDWSGRNLSEAGGEQAELDTLFHRVE